MAINKVEFGNQTLIDLTGDTATPEDVLGGKTFHTKSGEASVGTAGPYAGSATNGGPATTAKKLFGQDTRSVNSPPSFYLASGQNSTLVTEFKNRAVIDAPGSSSFGTLITVTPWMDSSGGLPVQTYVDNTGQKAIRFAQTSETWGSWSTLASNSDIPSVGNGTIKLQRNGVDIMTFTTNQNSNVTGNLIIPTKVSELTNDSEFISDDDPRLTDSRNAKDVYAWAKASTKPSYTASEVGAIATSAKGANGGVAELDSAGKVPSSQLPSFVDDVLEYDSLSNFPTTGEAGKIYIAKDTNKTYRWSGTTYVEISASLALGETSSTAYRGDRGKTAYDHSQVTSGNPHNVTKSDVGLGNVGNFKAVSTVASQGLTDTEKSNARANIGAGTSSLTLGETSSTAYRGDRGKTAYDHSQSDHSSIKPAFTEASTRANIATGETLATMFGKIKKFFTDLKTVAFTGSYNDLTNKPTIPVGSDYVKKSGDTMTGDLTISSGTGNILTIGSTTIGDNGTINLYSSGGYRAILTPSSFGFSSNHLYEFPNQGGVIALTNDIPSVVSTSANGLAPKVTDTTKFLKGDGTWATPTNTWTAMVGATSSANGSVGYVNATPPKDGYNTKFLRADGTWSVPSYPTVNNATLTIQKNGTNVQTFTANQSTNATANITVPTKVSELTNDKGYTTNTGTVTSVAAGTGLSGGTITSSGTISLANHSADYLSGGYLNIHPENNPTLIPFMNNDIAYLLKRGGSAIVKYDGTTQSVDINNCFDASPSYWSMNPTNITTIVIELTLHKAFPWTNTIYVDFGAAGWRAKNVKIEVMNSNYAQDVWTQKYNNTNNGLGHCYVITGHTPVGASNAGGGFNKVRFTFSSWNNTQFRIAQMGIYNYGSAGLRETFVPRDGSTLFGPLNLSYKASATMTYNSTNPQIGFSENGSQGVKIIYTDYDGYRAPYGLKVIGDGSASGGAWFEVEGNLYSNGGKQVPFLSTTPTSGQVIVTDGTTGGIKSSGYTIAKSVPADAKFTDNDTKNTAGSTDTSSKIFLIGATSQAANPQTYSHDTAYVGTDGCLYSGGTKVLTAHQDISGKVNKSGDTMTGQLKTSFKSAVAMGSYCAAATTIPNLCEELRYSSGCCGSVNISTAYAKDGITVATGWYNFLWIPHRSGGNSGAASGDNCDYGALYLSGMTISGSYLIRYASKAIAEIHNLYKDTGETIKYTSSVNAVVGDTTCTISDSSITTTSLIEPFSSNSTGDTIAIKNIAVTAGQAVLTFKALAVDTSFRLRITNV